jgi:hypothetical protein
LNDDCLAIPFIGLSYCDAMPRFLLYMLGLGVVALVGATALLLRPSAPGSSSLPEPRSARPVGNTAISHGGPAPSASPAPPAGPGSLDLGKEVIVARDTALLAAVPAAPDAEPARGAAMIRAGTRATIVAIAPAAPPDTAQTETYYKVQFIDGQAGWVAEHDLRSATEQGP